MKKSSKHTLFVSLLLSGALLLGALPAAAQETGSASLAAPALSSSSAQQPVQSASKPDAVTAGAGASASSSSAEVIVQEPAAQPQNLQSSAALQDTFSALGHSANIGWGTAVGNNGMIGITGKGYGLQAIRLRFTDDPALGITYTTQVQNIGWQDLWSLDGEMAGTVGKNLNIEAVRIALTGDKADQYDIYYRAHCKDLGWCAWAKNGEPAGSQSYGLQMEALQIIVQPKTSGAPSSAGSNQAQAFFMK